MYIPPLSWIKHFHWLNQVSRVCTSGTWVNEGVAFLGFVFSFQLLLILASWLLVVADYRTQGVDSLEFLVVKQTVVGTYSSLAIKALKFPICFSKSPNKKMLLFGIITSFQWRRRWEEVWRRWERNWKLPLLAPLFNLLDTTRSINSYAPLLWLFRGGKKSLLVKCLFKTEFNIKLKIRRLVIISCNCEVQGNSYHQVWLDLGAQWCDLNFLSHSVLTVSHSHFSRNGLLVARGLHSSNLATSIKESLREFPGLFIATGPDLISGRRTKIPQAIPWQVT